MFADETIVIILTNTYKTSVYEKGMWLSFQICIQCSVHNTKHYNFSMWQFYNNHERNKLGVSLKVLHLRLYSIK